MKTNSKTFCLTVLLQMVSGGLFAQKSNYSELIAQHTAKIERKVIAGHLQSLGIDKRISSDTAVLVDDLFLIIKHTGAYVAKYEITYNDNGTDKKIETGVQTAGWYQAFYFPGNATSFTLKGWAMTGLVWNPWGEIYNLSLKADDLNKCYRNGGTTLSRNWDNNCAIISSR